MLFTKRYSSAPSMPYCCIHAKCFSTICFGKEEKHTRVCHRWSRQATGTAKPSAARIHQGRGRQTWFLRWDRLLTSDSMHCLGSYLLGRGTSPGIRPTLSRETEGGLPLRVTHARRCKKEPQQRNKEPQTLKYRQPINTRTSFRYA